MKKKNLFLGILIAGALFSLASCGSKPNSSSTTPTTSKPTITIPVVTTPTGITTTDIESTTEPEEDFEPFEFVTTSKSSGLEITGFKKKTQKTVIDELVIPDEIDGTPVTSISYTAFRSHNFTGMTIKKIVFGKNLTNISFSGFNSDAFETIEIDSDNANYKVSDGCVLSKDGKSLYWVLDSTSKTLPTSVETLKSYSLDNVVRDASTTYVLPSNIKSIESQTISHSVETIILNEGLETIASDALDVKNVIVPSTVTHLAARSFGEVETISVDSGNVKYDSRDNSNCVIETATNKLVCVGKNYTIPYTVTTLGSGVFGYTYRFKSITIPNHITKIEGMFAFGFCYNLEELTIPNVEFYNWEGGPMLKTMNYAIEGCSSLKQFIIPNTITEITSTDLYGLSSLTSLYIPAVTKIGDDAFARAPKLTNITVNLSKTEFEALNYVDTSDVLKNINITYMK